MVAAKMSWCRQDGKGSNVCSVWCQSRLLMMKRGKKKIDVYSERKDDGNDYIKEQEGARKEMCREMLTGL